MKHFLSVNTFCFKRPILSHPQVKGRYPINCISRLSFAQQFLTPFLRIINNQGFRFRYPIASLSTRKTPDSLRNGEAGVASPFQKLAETLIRVILNHDHLYVGGDVSSWPRFSLDPQIVVLTQFRCSQRNLLDGMSRRENHVEEVLLLSGTTVTRLQRYRFADFFFHAMYRRYSILTVAPAGLFSAWTWQSRIVYSTSARYNKLASLTKERGKAAHPPKGKT